MHGLLWMYTDNDGGFYQKVIEHGLGDMKKLNAKMDEVIITVEYWSKRDLYARLQEMVNLLKEEFKE
jgi:hypothetical protein